MVAREAQFTARLVQYYASVQLVSPLHAHLKNLEYSLLQISVGATHNLGVKLDNLVRSPYIENLCCLVVVQMNSACGYWSTLFDILVLCMGRTRLKEIDHPL